MPEPYRWTKFSHLEVPSTLDPLPKAIIEKWVKPLYFGLHKPHLEEFFERNRVLITDDLICTLLEYCDWRPRTAAAYLCAIADRVSFLDQIGRLMLRSDFCFVGSAYCIALAEFNTSESRDFLKQYLDYYLIKPELWFNQDCAMGAIAYTDKINRTNNIENYLDLWREFVKDKPSWNLESSILVFEKNMARLHQLKQA